MPKTKEELKQEYQNQLFACYEAGDVGAFTDVLIANEEIFQPTMVGDNPEVEKNDAMIEALREIYAIPNKQKVAAFISDVSSELSRRKIDEIIKLGDIMDDYEEKIKNGEIPGTEYYAEDAKSTEKIAAILAKGSQAANKVKCIEGAGFTMANAINTFEKNDPRINRFAGFENAFDEANEHGYKTERITNEYWASKNLPDKKLEKLRSRLEGNFGDASRDLGYEMVQYRVEGNGYFEELPKDIAKMQKMTDQQLDDEMKKTVETADPEVKFYKECEKVGAYLNVWDNIIMPSISSIYDDKTRYAINDGLKEISDTLRNDLYGREGGLMAHDPSYVMTALDKAISKTKTFVTDREILQQRREFDGADSVNSKKLADNERDMTNAMVFAGNHFREKLEEIKSRLTQAYTPDIQAKKDTSFNKYIPAKLTAIEENNKKLNMLRKEKQLRADEKSAHDNLSNKLGDYLSYGGNKDFAGSYYAANALVENKNLGTSRVDLAKKKAADEFIASLKNTKPSNDTERSFITDLGSELNEKELKAADNFTRKKNELKKDILAGVVPGVFGASEEMADALASDMAYFASPEGKQLKAIQDSKREVFGAIKDSPNWKNYINNHPELSQNFAAPEYNSLAAKYGYTVSNDISRQINGTVFEKMPANAERLMRGGKVELQTMYNTTARKIANADALEIKINDLSDKAEKMLAVLNATNKTGHRNSGSYERMVADLTNIANLKSGKMINSKGQLVDITAAGVMSLLEDVDRSSKEYQEAHNGMFNGITKGFGRTRYNTSVLLQSFSASGKKALDNELGFIDKDKSIAEYKSEQTKLLDDIDKVTIDKGFGVVERKLLKSPEAKLDEYIAQAQRLNARHGSEQYDIALAAAVSLKEAIKSGSAAAIEQAANTASQRIEEYNQYKRSQILDGDLPNEKGRARLNAMDSLKFAANLSKLYSKSIAGAEADRNYEGIYKQEMNGKKEDILQNKEIEQQKINSAIVNEKITRNALKNAGINEMVKVNSRNYTLRGQDESLKGIDKVSASAASSAFMNLDLFTVNDTVLRPEYQQQAKQCIAELVLDKMIQLDHGNVLHKNMKNMNEEQFKQTAKDLSESSEFKASVPDKIDGTYVKKFMADYDNHGVMQVKNSIDHFRKAVKSTNANDAQRQPAPNAQPDAMLPH